MIDGYFDEPCAECGGKIVKEKRVVIEFDKNEKKKRLYHVKCYDEMLKRMEKSEE